MEIVVTQPKIGSQMVQEEKYFDYSSRAIYLRAIVLGGLKGVAYAAFMIMSPILMSVGVVAIEIKAILLTSFIGLAAGTLHLAIAQYVSVYTQYDILTFQAKRNIRMGRGGQKGPVPSPTLVAVASSVTYLVGGSVLLLAAGFIKQKEWRSSAVITLASLSLFLVGVIGAALGKALSLFLVGVIEAALGKALSLFLVGVIGAALGKAPVARSCARVLLGGWLPICIIWGKSKILDHIGLQRRKIPRLVMVNTWDNEAHIFSSDPGEWSVEEFSKKFNFAPPPNSAVPYKGLLFWCGNGGHLLGFDLYNSKCSRSFEIEQPIELGPMEFFDCVGLGVCLGCLRICQILVQSHICVWELKDYDSQGGGKWCLEHKVTLKEFCLRKISLANTIWKSEYSFNHSAS